MKPKRRVRVMEKFRIDELSGVVAPAQEGAQVVLMKRRSDEAGTEPARKGSVVQAVTGTTDGHQHGITIRKYGDGEIDIWVMSARKEGDEYGHDHNLLMAPDGTYSVMENAGHTHTLDSAAFAAALVVQATKSSGEVTAMTEKEIEALKAKNARLEAICKLSSEHRQYFETLDETAQEGFLAKSDAERTAAIAVAKRAAEEADPVVYTTSSGIAIRKSAGEVAVALAKDGDARAKEIAELRTENQRLAKATEDATFEKRATTELAHLPGTAAVRGRMLKFAEAIEDPTEREQAIGILKAQNSSGAMIFKTIGTDGAVLPGPASDESDPQVKLDALTKKYRESHPGMSFEKAQVAVLETAEGQSLYVAINQRDAAERGAMAH